MHFFDQVTQLEQGGSLEVVMVMELVFVWTRHWAPFGLNMPSMIEMQGDFTLELAIGTNETFKFNSFHSKYVPLFFFPFFLMRLIWEDFLGSYFVRILQVYRRKIRCKLFWRAISVVLFFVWFCDFGIFCFFCSLFKILLEFYKCFRSQKLCRCFKLNSCNLLTFLVLF